MTPTVYYVNPFDLDFDVLFGSLSMKHSIRAGTTTASAMRSGHSRPNRLHWMRPLRMRSSEP